MQDTRVQSLGQEDPLQKEMATFSNILAWKIPWTEEPGGLQSMGSQKSCTWLNNNSNKLVPQCMLSHVWLFVTPLDCESSDSCAHGISQARILEWVVRSCSSGSSWPRDELEALASPALAGRFFTTLPPGKPNNKHYSSESDSWDNISLIVSNYFFLVKYLHFYLPELQSFVHDISLATWKAHTLPINLHHMESILQDSL